MAAIARPLLLLLAVVLPTVAAPAGALTVERLDVGVRGRSYFVDFEARLAAPPAAVMAVLTDYADYPRLDARILEAREVGEHEGRPLLYTRLYGCLAAWFCREMERYEQLEEGARRLVARALPGRGDLKSGYSETRVEPDGDGTRVRYHTEFDPSFWMPRWLVQSAMLRTLERGTLGMFGNVEARARELAP